MHGINISAIPQETVSTKKCVYYKHKVSICKREEGKALLTTEKYSESLKKFCRFWRKREFQGSFITCDVFDCSSFSQTTLSGCILPPHEDAALLTQSATVEAPGSYKGHGLPQQRSLQDRGRQRDAQGSPWKLSEGKHPTTFKKRRYSAVRLSCNKNNTHKNPHTLC